MSGYESAGELSGRAWKRLNPRTKSLSPVDHMGMELAPAPVKQVASSGRNQSLRKAFIEESKAMMKAPIFGPGSAIGSTRNDPTGMRAKFMGTGCRAGSARPCTKASSRGRSASRGRTASRGRASSRGRSKTKKRI